ncbi:alpha-(1-2)-phosphatidylinositol mannoside mannosyltransferase [Kutzneria viridogrisea]|uniref:Alpha-1,2-mannosyltransferase n=1 Tax=Kutzneria viridogrisea TaxID=47990 RepID=A0ABR6BEI8_9PSEU|nr:alpha-1,2-mannosyltransferase [Kutzneria viridogrisea]
MREPVDAASNPAPRSLVRRIWWLAAALVLVGAIAASAVYICAFDDHHFTDLDVYLGGGQVWRDGADLYQAQLPTPFPKFTLRFTYPPLAAVLFSALTVLPAGLAAALFTAGTMGALAASLRLVLVRLLPVGFARRYPLPVLALASTLAATWLEPVRETISFGQVNVLLLVLVLADCLVARPWWPRGLLIGLAAAVKLTPAVFVLFFLVRRQWRPVLTAVGGFLGLCLAGALLAPRDSLDYWFGALFDTKRIGVLGFSYNQSLRGVLARVAVDTGWQNPLWLGLSVLVLAVTVLVAARARAAGEDVAALLAVAACGLLVSPVSWAHHWVWVAPGLVWAAVRVARAHSWTACVLGLYAWYLCLFTPYRLPPQLREPGQYWDFGESLLGNLYVWLAIAMLGSMAVWTARLRLGAASRLRGSGQSLAQPA